MPAWLEDMLPGNAAAEITAVLVGLGIVLLLVAALRRRSRNRGARISESLDSRIGVLEWSIVDERRRLVLVRRDDVEHLVMIGGPSDLVIEANIGARHSAPAVERPPAPRAQAPAPRPAATAQNAAAVATLEQAALAYAPQAAADGRKANGRAEAHPAPESRGGESAVRQAAPKPRPPLAAVPAQAGAAPAAARPAVDTARRNGSSAGDGSRPMPPAIEPDRGNSAARRPTASGRKEPSIAPSTGRWAGNGQTAAIALGEPASTQGRLTNGRTEAANDQNGWAGNDDIENEIVKALSIDPFPPLAFPATPGNPGRQSDAVLKTSGSATVAPGATLGDLAEKLEEALAREVRSSNQGRAHLDLDLDAFTSTDRAQPAAAAPYQTANSARPPENESRRETPAAVNDDPPVINLSSRRRDMGDPIEDEMARLLGELTDGARR